MNININARGRSGSSKSSKSDSKSKVGKIIGKVGSVAAKFGNLIPGVGGIVSTIGKIASKNDPEWWQHYPSNGVTTNIPLQEATHQMTGTRMCSAVWSTEFSEPTLSVKSANKQSNLRPCLLEMTTLNLNTDVIPKGYQPTISDYAVINPTSDMISTYVLQNIRKVVNAVPLQTVEAYRSVLIVNATAYALKHQLDKWIFFSKHNAPYMPSMMNSSSFPVLAPTNYATLVALRDRLSEHIKASVRLPHTLCCYLAWRFGRIYRVNDNAKAGFVVYDVLPIDAPLDWYTRAVDSLIQFVATGKDLTGEQSVDGLPMAQTDLFNAYIKHVEDVLIPDETQCIYDPKEFVLRTNHDSEPLGDIYTESEVDQIFMDSHLDNPTTFIASTVSTRYAPTNKSVLRPSVKPLFPVGSDRAFMLISDETIRELADVTCIADSPTIDSALEGSIPKPVADMSRLSILGLPLASAINRLDWTLVSVGQAYWNISRCKEALLSLSEGSNHWLVADISVFANGGFCYNFKKAKPETVDQAIKITDYETRINANVVLAVSFCKALELYNREIMISVINPNAPTSDYGIPIDLTSCSYDMAYVSGANLEVTQTQAFANLMTEEVISYKSMEGQAATDAAKTLLSDIKKEVAQVPTVAGTIPAVKPPDQVSGEEVKLPLA